MSYKLTDLADILRPYVPVVEEKGKSKVNGQMISWKEFGRSSNSGYNKVTHVMNHHTASNATPANDVAYCNVNSDSRPLCNILLDRNGAAHLCAAGPSNTNGSGHDWWGGGVPDDSMNAEAIGIEVANEGTGEPYPTIQQTNLVIINAVLCKAYELPVGHCRAHFEWTDRKIDPAGNSKYATGGNKWNMELFRSDIQNKFGSLTPPTLGDDVLVNLITHKKEVAVFAQYSGGYKVWVENPDILNVLHMCSPVKKVTSFDSTWFLAAGPILPGTPLPYACDAYGRKK